MHSMILLTTVTTPSEEKKASSYLEPVSSIRCHLINKSVVFVYLSIFSIYLRYHYVIKIPSKLI